MNKGLHPLEECIGLYTTSSGSCIISTSYQQHKRAAVCCCMSLPYASVPWHACYCKMLQCNNSFKYSFASKAQRVAYGADKLSMYCAAGCFYDCCKHCISCWKDTDSLSSASWCSMWCALYIYWWTLYMYGPAHVLEGLWSVRPVMKGWAEGSQSVPTKLRMHFAAHMLEWSWPVVHSREAEAYCILSNFMLFMHSICDNRVHCHGFSELVVSV